MISEAVRGSALKEKLAAAGMDAQPESPASFAEYLKREVTKWGRIVKETGVTAQ